MGTRGKGCEDDFIADISAEYELVKHLFLPENQVPLVMTAEDEERFQNSSLCHICNGPLHKETPAHRDHCHFTGEYMVAIKRRIDSDQMLACSHRLT